jgi:hypothetical protein
MERSKTVPRTFRNHPEKSRMNPVHTVRVSFTGQCHYPLVLLSGVNIRTGKNNENTGQ